MLLYTFALATRQKRFIRRVRAPSCLEALAMLQKEIPDLIEAYPRGAEA